MLHNEVERQRNRMYDLKMALKNLNSNITTLIDEGRITGDIEFTKQLVKGNDALITKVEKEENDLNNKLRGYR